jgi:copper(I)-binding protein
MLRLNRVRGIGRVCPGADDMPGAIMRRILLVLAAGLIFCAGRANAADYDVGSIHIANPWARAVPKGAKIAAGYLTITNKGTAPDRLTCVSVAVAAKCEVHSMTMDGGVMNMRLLPDGLTIKPGETVAFKPGSFHLMFVDLNAPLEAGKTVKGTLKFERAGSVDVEYALAPVGATEPPKPGMHDGMKMH